MDIKVKRRLYIIDNIVNNMVENYYPGVGHFSNIPINYGDWPSYKENVIQAVLRTAQIKFILGNIIDSWGYEIECNLIDYVTLIHGNRMYEEYKKTTHYIDNGE